MINPVRRLKDILGEIQRNGRQSLELARLQAERMSSIELRVAMLEDGLRDVSQSVQDNTGTAQSPGDALLAALKRVGVLNYETPVVSGEDRFLRRYFATDSSAVVIDVGANTGQFAALARSIAPDAVIHSFEPHPAAYAALARNAAGIGNATHNMALGDEAGEIAFYDYVDEQGSQHASVYREVIEGVHKRVAAAVTVRCARLDDIADPLGIGHIGLLKIDAEGHELAVLRGARTLIAAGTIDVIQFEFNEMNVIARVFMRDFFETLPAYRLFRLQEDGAIPLEVYDPRFMEVFAYQNIACIRRDLDYSWILADRPQEVLHPRQDG